MDDERTRRDLELDLEVGLRIEGYRWVEWNRAELREAPLHEPGRFVGHPGDLLAHLYVAASPDTPPGPDPFAHLPRYSSEAATALRAAERAGLFTDGGSRLSCTPRGTWRVSVERAGFEMEDDSLPRLLVRAALRLAGPEGPDGPAEAGATAGRRPRARRDAGSGSPAGEDG